MGASILDSEKKDLMVMESAAWFHEHYDELTKKHGHKYLVIYDCEVQGAYDSHEEALIEGSKRYILGTFAVQETDRKNIPFISPTVFMKFPKLNTRTAQFRKLTPEELERIEKKKKLKSISSQKTLYIMMGIQGSGKSTYCRQFLSFAERVNLDSLHTRNKEALLIADCQNKGIDYVIDNTNPTKEDRARYIPSAKASGYRVVGYFMQSVLQDCISRNALRNGKERVPDKAIVRTSNILELPSFEEGFDELYFVRIEGSEIDVSEWREEG